MSEPRTIWAVVGDDGEAGYTVAMFETEQDAQAARDKYEAAVIGTWYADKYEVEERDLHTAGAANDLRDRPRHFLRLQFDRDGNEVGSRYSNVTSRLAFADEVTDASLVDGGLGNTHARRNGLPERWVVFGSAATAEAVTAAVEALAASAAASLRNGVDPLTGMPLLEPSTVAPQMTYRFNR